MKIVLAHKYFYRGGGTATYLFALMEELQRRGHECIPFTVAYDQTVPREYWDYYVSAPAGGETTHLKDMRLSPGDKLRLLARAVWSREAAAQARRLARDLRPEVAYVHNLYSYMSPSPIRAFHQAGLPVVMRVADYNMVCPGLNVLREGEACVECVDGRYSRAIRYRCHKGSRQGTAARVVSMKAHQWLGVYGDVDRFLTPSLFLREVLIRAGYPPEKIHHLPSFFPPVGDGPSAREEDYVLCFGRVAPEKGLDVLLRAMALLPARPRLLLAGSDVDGERGRLEALARELDVPEVQFVGMKQRAELDALIAGALFTVVPSKWYDNCPMSILESFSHGKPVIGAAIGGIPEQITGDCGLLFQPGDAESLATQMQRLLADAALRRGMGQAAYERLCTVYSIERHLKALLGHFTVLRG